MTSPTFEAVEEGHELPILNTGPITTAHLMRWSAAVENWHKIHYDQDFAVGHDKLPSLLVNGSFKQQLILQVLRRFTWPDGWVWKVKFQFRAMDVLGDSLSVWGRVSGTRRAEAFGLVDLDLGIRNGAGKDSTTGTAVVALPYRDGPPVPYPFVPPAVE